MRSNARLLVATALALAAFFFGCNSWAYLQPTHQNIAFSAADKSVLADISTIHNLGFRHAYDDNAQKFPNFVTEYVERDIGLELTSGPKNIHDLIGDGAMQEDISPRALAHFYDPTTDLGLSVSALSPTCQAAVAGASGAVHPVLPWLIAGISFIPSPDWALEDKHYVEGQDYSYEDARHYFYWALTTLDKATRDQYWGKTFQALGQVIHHVEDMAQPQHVRNDPHLFLFKEGVLSGEPCENHSLYEQYTNEKRGNRAFYVPPYALDLSVFSKPRSFWKNETSSGTGLAEFTNSNFFSAGTNAGSGRYSLPMLTGEATHCVFPNDGSQAACPVYPDPYVLDGQTFVGEMWFLDTLVTDYVHPSLGETQQTHNRLATTESFFDQDLQKAGSQPVYSLNRFNFDAAHLYLIPRAVAYSTGMLNYFFRGKMEISLPDEGVYAVADTAVPADSDPQAAGFFIVNLKLRNLTGGTDAQGNAKEPISTGSSFGHLIAVAKFHRNNCYALDLSGEYGSRTDDAGRQDWKDNCRNPDEEIVVSDLAYAPDGVNSSPQEITFFFPNKIPFSATDLYLQVIYQGPLGPLGNDPDAVVVTTKDISEPTYLFNYTNWDIDTSSEGWPLDMFSQPGSPNSLTFHDWCTMPPRSGDPAPYPDDATCGQMRSYTLRTQFSPTSAPISGYDPTGSTRPVPNWHYAITTIPAFQPIVEMPGLPGRLSRLAFLTDADTSNVELFVYEEDDTYNLGKYSWNNWDDFWWHNITVAPTINQMGGDGIFISTSPHYQLVRGQYIDPNIDPNLLDPFGDPSLYAQPIPQLQLQCSKLSATFGGSASCNWTPPYPQ